MRLRPLVREYLGEDRPKQYVRLLGPHTLLRQTLDRAALAIACERTVVVTVRRHGGYMAEELGADGPPHLLVQPSDRGTAAGILYAAHWISWRDPAATVVVLPSDHFILGEAAFMAHVAEVSDWADRHPERLVLLGAQPTFPEVDYGWIAPGEQLDDLSSGPVRAVRGFSEKPSAASARTYLRSGHLWNTSIIIGKVGTLIGAGRQGAPDLSERIARLKAFAGDPDQAALVSQAYEHTASTDFARAILEGCPRGLGVSRLSRLVWSDLGSPRRVLEVLTRMRVRPAWARRLVLSLA
jgi:mannose-1-phosphate guanylyltransferase